MNDEQQLQYIKSEFEKKLKDGLLNLHICWLIDQVEKLQSMKQVIPWQKYDPENPPKNFVSYLISNGEDISKGYFAKFGNEYSWYPDDCGSFDGDDVTHYAPINLPGEE